MPWNPDIPNNNQTPNSPYTPGGYEKTKLRKLLLLVGVLFAIPILIFIVRLSTTDKYTKSASVAAREHTPNAKVKNVKVAGDFAIAIVSDPAATGQANAGNITIFKVNQDGSMVQLANGSYFSPLDLLELGIPLATQAELTGSDLGHVKQDLANQCGYSNGAIGYSGFDGSFNPNQWQIDAATLSDLEQKLSNVIGNQNTSAADDKTVVCVNVTQKNSNLTTDKTTYISTFTLQLQFITNDGTLTTHTITFSIGPKHYRNYTLDGQDI